MARKEPQAELATQETVKPQQVKSFVQKPAQPNRQPSTYPAKDPKASSLKKLVYRVIFGSKQASGTGKLHAVTAAQAPSSVQASAARTADGPEHNIQAQPATLVQPTENIESQKQPRGDADPPGNEGADGENGDEFALWGRASELLERQPGNSSPMSSGVAKNCDMGTSQSGWNDKKGVSNEERVRERRSEVEFESRQQQWNDEYRQLQARIDHLYNENGILKRDLKTVESLLADAQTLSQVRGEELKGAQVFLTKADVLSTTDIVHQVTSLNDEISQTASRLGELLQNTESPYRAQRQLMNEDSWILGKKLTSDLHELSNNHSVVNSRTEPNPLLIQIVFQIAITRWCGILVSSWEPNDRQLADSMLSIYSGIRQAEDQAVSGRWRAITRAQLRRSSTNDANGLQSFMLAMKGILNTAGWSIQEADQQKFERKLILLSKAVQNLRKALGEDVTSMDIEVATIEAGRKFNPSYMDDSFRDGKSSKVTPEKVVGTTGLGLWIRKGQTNEYDIILPPQVALEGVLKEAMKPVSTKPQRRPSTRHGSRPGTAAGSGVSP